MAVDGDGATVAYRKMWLGDAEAVRFTPGDEPAVVEVDGWRLGLAICKDTGIPQHAASTARLGIDAYVAGVLDSADDAGVQDERARRIAADHHVWVVVASFAGSTGGGYEHAAARSRIWSPDGVVVARAGSGDGWDREGGPLPVVGPGQRSGWGGRGRTGSVHRRWQRWSASTPTPTTRPSAPGGSWPSRPRPGTGWCW